MTSTPRVAKTRQRQREAGLVRVELMAFVQDIEKVREYASMLLINRMMAEQLTKPPDKPKT
jgi:hypothetical protein